MQLKTSIRLDTWESENTQLHQLHCSIARFDEWHPIVSGNKYFKLSLLLDDAMAQQKKYIATFGGAYSNHLVATAYACRERNINSMGIVRGEAARFLSPTLLECQRYGMQLYFLSRTDYALQPVAAALDQFNIPEESIYWIPEGGFHPLGAQGASAMYAAIQPMAATHLVMAVGTATTLAGFCLQARAGEELIAVPVLKNLTDIPKRLKELCGQSYLVTIWPDAHRGGYAKQDPALLQFMNHFYQATGIPTDFVYTGKMLLAVEQAMVAGYFPSGSRIVCIHSGGLQGNRSLPTGTLLF